MATFFLNDNSLRYIGEKEIKKAQGITDTNSSAYEELYSLLGILQKDFSGDWKSKEYDTGFRAVQYSDDTWKYYHLDSEYFNVFLERVRSLLKQTPDKRFSQNDLVSALKISNESDKFYLERSMRTSNTSKGFKGELKNDIWYCYYEMPEEERRQEEKILKRIDELSAKIERIDTEKEPTHEKPNNKEGFVESRYVLYMFLFFAVVFACIHFFDMNAISKIVQMFTGNS